MSMRKDLEDIRATIVSVSPFLSSLLIAARIVETDYVDTAGVTSYGEILINPEWWKKLSFPTKVFILMHEVLHVAFQHPLRGKGRVKPVYNLAGDCVINHVLRQFLSQEVLKEAGL